MQDSRVRDAGMLGSARSGRLPYGAPAERRCGTDLRAVMLGAS